MNSIYKFEKILGGNFKWLAWFYLNFKSFTVYRLNTLSYLLTQVTIIIGTLIVWYYNIENGSNGISFKEIVTYYLIGQLFILQIEPHWSISEDIQNGKFSNQLIKPGNTWMSYFVEDLGVNLFTNFIKVSLSLLLALIFNSFIVLPQKPETYLVFIFSLVLGYLTSLFLSFLASFSTFWTVNSHGILELYNQLRLFFSGWFFPLNILPFLKPFLFLPFSFTYYFQVQVFLEKYDFWSSLAWLLYGYGLLGVLMIITKIVYNIGLKKYESVGL